MYTFYLTCPRGLENIAAKEIKLLINKKSKISNGGISFTGDKEDLYNINLQHRTGMVLLVELFATPIKTINDLYNSVKNFKWHKIINPNHTFIIKTKTDSQSENFKNQNFITLKAKDAIVDQIFDKNNLRPSISKLNPNFYIHLIIKKNKLKVYLNSSGKPLFMRGYKTKIHKASLNESLAAGIIQLSNWQPNTPLYDFMCGSGTICIEAAMQAFNIPANIMRENFSFFNWNDFDYQLWNNLKKEAQKKIKYHPIDIYGSDLIQQNIDLCLDSSMKLSISKYLNFKKADFKTIKSKYNKGTIIINPPYGHRIGEMLKLKKLYSDIGDHLKKNFSGFEAYLFTGNLELLKSIGLRTKSKTILKNGKIDCRLAYYPLKSGKY